MSHQEIGVAGQEKFHPQQRFGVIYSRSIHQLSLVYPTIYLSVYETGLRAVRVGPWHSPVVADLNGRLHVWLKWVRPPRGQSVGNTEILVAIRLSSRFAMWPYNSSSNDWPIDYSFKAHVMFNINGLQCVGVHYRKS